MSKRVGFAYLASCVLPFVSVAILMLRLLEPWTRPAALLIYLVGCGLLILAMQRHARVRTKLSLAKHHALAALDELGLLKKRAALAFTVFGGALLIFPVLLPLHSTDFLTREQGHLREEFTETEAQLERTARYVTSAQEQFHQLAAKVDLRNRTSTENLRAAWTAYLDHAVLLDSLVNTHKHFYQLAVRSPELADRAFLIGFRALVLQMQGGLHISNAVGNRAHIESMLNEPNDDLGLGENTYLSFVNGLTRAESLVQLEAGYAYLKLLRRVGHLGDQSAQRDQVIDAAASTIRLFGKEPQVLIDAPLDRLEQRAFVAWFPLQKGAAQAISPVRTTHRDNFIRGADLTLAQGKLRAGDILLQRRNWYLTNLGIPGFWPHAALYVGTPAELDEEFGTDTSIVTNGLRPSAYLAQNMPQVFHALTRLDNEGRAPRVIEAVGEGVIVQPFETSGHADYMAALRPRLSDDARLHAVIEAFKHFGKPYDYNFEFSTDESVVCSELVFKAFQNSDSFPGITFPLTRQNGRLVLPPNDIARVFDDEYDNRQQMDFVFFLDGNEALKSATFSDVESFRDSWRRKKWDIAQD